MNLILISLKINLFLPWYSHKIVELALNNNHSLNFIERLITSILSTVRRCWNKHTQVATVFCFSRWFIFLLNNNPLHKFLSKHKDAKTERNRKVCVQKQEIGDEFHYIIEGSFLNKKKPLIKQIHTEPEYNKVTKYNDFQK